MPGLSDLFRRQEDRHRALFSVIKDQPQVDAIVQATQAVVGELDRGHTGLLFVVPISQVYGLHKKRESD
jgi:hypothetical protein